MVYDEINTANNNHKKIVSNIKAACKISLAVVHMKLPAVERSLQNTRAVEFI